MHPPCMNPVAFFLARTSTLLGRRMLSGTVNTTDGTVINVILDPTVTYNVLANFVINNQKCNMKY